MVIIMDATTAARRPLLTRDKSFYKTAARLMTAIIFQNLISYSVNMADNIMLGMYSQNALSGAATVNQIQFMVQQLTLAVGDSIVVIGGQYWGKKKSAEIRLLTFYALAIGIIFAAGVFIWTFFFPAGVLSIFTKNADYIAEGVKYLKLICYTYPLYIISTILLSSLRSVETVHLALKVSFVSLLVNIGINYLLIFGKLGFPELGIFGAAVGTLVSRILELVIILFYIIFVDKKLKLFCLDRIKYSKSLLFDFLRVLWPSALSNFLWSVATPIQTSVLGHLEDDAIAANSVATTIYQYVKIIAIGEASASAVIIGKTIGENPDDDTIIKDYSRTLQILYIIFGIILGFALFFLRIPFLSLYDLSDNALRIADGMLIVLSFAMVGMSYQMPASVGIVKGGGDVKFIMYMNMISTWGIVMPLTFISAYVLHMPAVFIVAVLNSDQVFKCLPVAIHCNRYKWIKRIAK